MDGCVGVMKEWLLVGGELCVCDACMHCMHFQHPSEICNC